MANVQEDRPRLSYGTRERRSVGLLVLLFLAVIAAIFFIRNMSARRHAPAASPPVASTEVPAAPPPAEQTDQAAAAAPAAAADDEPAMSARKQAGIARVVEEGRPALAACYQRALVRNEKLVNGNLKVRLSVAPSGRVNTVNVSGPPSFHALDPCLKAAVSKWTFPSAATSYQAEFPLELRGAE